LGEKERRHIEKKKRRRGREKRKRGEGRESQQAGAFGCWLLVVIAYVNKGPVRTPL
jgi:hypothetical protein